MNGDLQKRIFSKNLRYYISLSRKTQREIAASINVAPQTFNSWCMGIALPRMSRIQALADYFSINKSDLLDFQSVIRGTSSIESLLRLSGYPVCHEFDENLGEDYQYIKFSEGSLEVSDDELINLGDMLFELIDHEMNNYKRWHPDSWRDQFWIEPDVNVTGPAKDNIQDNDFDDDLDLDNDGDSN